MGWGSSTLTPGPSMRSGVVLPRAVWILGWVSLATDAASEAIYPLLPFFLTQLLGGGALSLGIVEGVAEATNSLLKVASGAAADRSPTKRPLVLAGYLLSSAARPLMALAQAWPHVFAIRFFDRVGKGIRSAPRDALLARWATEATRGRVFSFHRGMDHAGAVIGPLLATAFLWLYPGAYRTLFAATVIPGALSVWLVLLVREPADPTPEAPVGVRAHLSDLRPLCRGPLGGFLVVLALFALANSTDAYLLLRLSEVLGDVTPVPLIWAALHVVKAGVSFLAGGWSDRFGRWRMIGAGWLIYVMVYLGFAMTTTPAGLIACFLVYGCYFGLTEGAERALIAAAVRRELGRRVNETDPIEILANRDARLALERFDEPSTGNDAAELLLGWLQRRNEERD